MNISIRDTKSEKLYPKLKEIGFFGIDISFPGWEKGEYILSKVFESDLLSRLEKIEGAGLKVTQTHLTYYPGHLPPLGDGGYEAYEEFILPLLSREIELTAKINCGVAVAHMYYRGAPEECRERNVCLIKKLLPKLRENNVILAIENTYGLGYSTSCLSAAEDVLYYVDHFKSEHIGACLDVGHAVTLSLDPIAMIKTLGGAIKAVHLHSNVPGRDLHLPPMMTKGVDWKEIYDALTDVGYSGSFNMETVPPADLNFKAAVAYYELAYNIAEGIIKKDKSFLTD